MENGKSQKWWKFSDIGTDIKTAQKRIEEQKTKRFEQIINGEALAIEEHKCIVKLASKPLRTPAVKPEVKEKILLPDKRELKRISYHYESYIRGNRRVGRRRVTVRIPLDYYEQLSHQFNLEKHFIYHPRTSQRIEPTSSLERKRPSFATNTITVFNTEDNLELKVKFKKKVALVTPAVGYHRRKNQQLKRGYRFIVKDGEIIPQKYDELNQEWKPIDASQVKYRKTHQYKTVWFTRRSRRK